MEAPLRPKKKKEKTLVKEEINRASRPAGRGRQCAGGGSGRGGASGSQGRGQNVEEVTVDGEVLFAVEEELESEPMPKPEVQPDLDAPETEAVVEMEEGRENNEIIDVQAPAPTPLVSASMELQPQAPQTQKAYARLSPSGEHLVVDEAFSVAFQDQCNSVLFKPKEVLLLLDALECEVPEAVLENADSLSASVPPWSCQCCTQVRSPPCSTYARNYNLCGRGSFLWLRKSRDWRCGVYAASSPDQSDGLPLPADPLHTVRGRCCAALIGRQDCSPPVLDSQAGEGVAALCGIHEMIRWFVGHDLLTLDAASALVEEASRVPADQALLRVPGLLRLLDKWWSWGTALGMCTGTCTAQPSPWQAPSFFAAVAGPDRDSASKTSKASEPAAKKGKKEARLIPGSAQEH